MACCCGTSIASQLALEDQAEWPERFRTVAGGVGMGTSIIWIA